MAPATRLQSASPREAPALDHAPLDTVSAASVSYRGPNISNNHIRGMHSFSLTELRWIVFPELHILRICWLGDWPMHSQHLQVQLQHLPG